MTSSAVQFLRRVLHGWIEKLDRMEQASPRSHRTRWYEREFHLPPAVVGVTSTILLYGVLVFNNEIELSQALVLALFVLIIVILFTTYLHRDQRELVKSDDAMALLAVVFFTTLIWIKLIAVYSIRFSWFSPYATPVTISALLTALLLNPRLAMVFSFGVSLIFGIINSFSLPLAMVGALGSATMIVAVSRARSTTHVARAGIIVGVVQAAIVLFLSGLLEWDERPTIVAMVSAFASGVVASAFSLGVLPFLEAFFSRLSNLRLVELAAVNHPLLQKMSIEAPGTYHHSLIVASLAEDAANAIGANGLLCRVGAYFHDIGKMVKAEYFIENQGAIGNPHDGVAPSLSKLVITSHVKEGLALARQYKLDAQIADFIPQHHGTSQIEYFYQKALKLEREELEPEAVSEETYRYPGPKPQSKETAIVMMADSVEAAGRALEDPTHQRYKDLVQKIINKKMNDGQLSESPLTLKDLRIIAERFTATLASVHHARIPYPENEAPKKERRDEPTALP